jgi:hypothetical protein
MEKVLKMYVDKYGFINIPITNLVKSISWYFLDFRNDGQGQYVFGTCLSIMFDNVMIAISVDKISDNELKDFNEIEIELLFNDDMVTIKYQLYVRNTLITRTKTIKLLHKKDIVIRQIQIPYSIEIEFL